MHTEDRQGIGFWRIVGAIVVAWLIIKFLESGGIELLIGFLKGLWQNRYDKYLFALFWAFVGGAAVWQFGKWVWKCISEFRSGLRGK